MPEQLTINQEQLAELCRRYKVKKLSLFGSLIHGDFGPDSDVDMLVEFQEGAKASYLDMAQMQIELSELVGREVELRTSAELSRYFRDQVVQEAQVQYAA